MPIFISRFFLFLLFLFPQTLFAKTEFNVIKVLDAHGMAGDPFKNIKSCSPSFKWEPLSDTGVTYDIMIWKAVEARRGDVIPIPGEEVFYKEGLTGNSYELPHELPGKTKFLWSVRGRNSQGKVTEWASYYYRNLFVGIERNFVMFGFQTPLCSSQNQASNESNFNTSSQKSEEVGPAGKLSLTRNLTDESKIKKLLSEGMGGFVIYHTATFLKKEDEPFNTRSRESLIKSIKERKDRYIRNGQLFYISPLENNERYLNIGKNNSFFLIGNPGEYTITRLLFNGHMVQYSNRIYKKITVEPGKIKYIGDTIIFGNRGGFFGKNFTVDLLLGYDFEEAKANFLNHFPGLSDHFIESQTKLTSNEKKQK